MATVSDFIEELEAIAPPDLADESDRIGLQVGTADKPVEKVCVSLDTTLQVIDAAIDEKADLLIAHHPLIYSPLQSVAVGNPVADRVIKLVKADISLFVLHTNFDSALGGTNDVLARMLGVSCLTPLVANKRDSFYKIVVFVPAEAVEKVRNAMAEAGAGVIGQYTHCSFRSPGTGSFVPLPAADPYVGDIGKLVEVKELRLEMICAGSWLNDVLAAMIEAHPYDEVAYDLYELANEPIIYGYGRVGLLDEEMTLQKFADRVRTSLKLETMRVMGDPKKTISRVALCTGSGSSFYKNALAAGADVYVTGEAKYHDMLDANAAGLAMIEAGHFETEKPGMVDLTERLQKTFAGSGVQTQYIE